MKMIAGNFVNYIISNLTFPLEEQDHMESGKDFWCLDWWVIEICKYFFEGEEGYLRFPIARRLIGNRSFRKEDIVEATLSRIEMVEQVKELDSNNIIVIEKARGLDTAMVNSLKNWDNITVFVKNTYPQVVEKTKGYLSQFSNVKVVEGKGFGTNSFMASAIGFQGGIK